jgi:hypothetical protein
MTNNNSNTDNNANNNNSSDVDGNSTGDDVETDQGDQDGVERTTKTTKLLEFADPSTKAKRKQIGFLTAAYL